MKWQAKFELGNARIDFEHMIFFDIIVAIEEEHEAGKDKERLHRLLLELMKYIQFHFVSEENIMIDCDYPEVGDHMRHHEQINESFNNKIMAYEMNQCTIGDVLAFLVDWFVNHTIHEDRKISEYIKKTGYSPTHEDSRIAGYVKKVLKNGMKI